MTRVASAAGVFAVVTFVGGALVLAQNPPAGQAPGARGRGGPPQPAANLQVLPKDMPRQQLIGVMQQFSQALGVTCAHCHVFVGPNDPGNDFASDMKPQKNTARAMLRMVMQIRPMVQAAVAPKPADRVTQVGCAMCHRGQAIPVVPEPAPGARGAGPGPGRGNL